MSEVFFTADTHFGHKNIIKYCNRPFGNIEHMNEEIISKWNSVVKNEDFVFHLGDFCFGGFANYFSRLNGKIIFIKGNHDDSALKHCKSFFRFYEGIHEIKVNNVPITLCHYAMRVWNKSHFGSWHLYGHSHGMLEDDIHSMSFDCGVDTNNFYPYSFEDVQEKMSKKEFVSNLRLEN